MDSICISDTLAVKESFSLAIASMAVELTFPDSNMTPPLMENTSLNESIPLFSFLLILRESNSNSMTGGMFPLIIYALLLFKLALGLNAYILLNCKVILLPFNASGRFGVVMSIRTLQPSFTLITPKLST
ncbi:MAG: hypothetical protein BWY67_01188 [Bacteroidetes bacterium ADurb.Bin397]|nr:MAG: hypothetical protein BWY67_01188 [Bacteroidetes bacterium ADurb.Bin397]